MIFVRFDEDLDLHSGYEDEDELHDLVIFTALQCLRSLRIPICWSDP